MKNVWPLGITLFFVVFGAGLAVFIMAALRQPDQLVRPDYYEHEIQYQKQIDRELGSSGVAAADVAHFVPGQGLVIALPPGATHASLHLYRPSDASLDRSEPYAPGADGRQIIPAGSLRAGFWRVRLDWQAAGTDCFKEVSFQVSP